MYKFESINYSKFFNNDIKVSQILFNHSFKSLSSDKYREIIFKELSINSNHIAVPKQIHSSQIRWINKSGFYQNTDGLVTDNHKIILFLQTADCPSIFIFDKKYNIKGLVHSGWQGTKNKIINNAINLMFGKGSSPLDILIIIGASIHKCCYEIGVELIDYFDKDCIYFNNNKIYLSLQEQILIDLRKLDIPRKNIQIDSQCTFMNNKLSSYRRDQDKAGRMLSLLGDY